MFREFELTEYAPREDPEDDKATRIFNWGDQAQAFQFNEATEADEREVQPETLL